MAIQNALNITDTGVITHDGNGKFEGSIITNGSVLVGSVNNKIQNTGVVPKGNLLVGNGITAPTILAVGADTQVLTADSTQASGVKWAPQGTTGPGVPKTFNYYSDFLETQNQNIFDVGFSKSTPPPFNLVDKDHPGVVCGSATESIYLDGALTAQGINIGGGEITLNTLMAQAVNAASGFCILGLNSPNDKAGLIFDPANTGNSNWNVAAMQASTATYLDTGIPALPLGVWQKLKVVIAADGLSVEGFVNDVSVGVVNTNLPLNTTKLAGGIKLNSWPSTLNVDYLEYAQTVTSR